MVEAGMATPSDIRLEYIGIANILATRKIQVPRYQRSYAWEASHVTAFLEDIQAAMADNEPEYFLGSIVATSVAEGSAEVVDGQQRLATTAILIAAVRDWYAQNGDKEGALSFETDFLAKTERRTKEKKAKLQLNDVDHGYYLARVIARPGEDERTDASAEKSSHQRIQNACELARAFVDDVAQKTKSADDRLNDLVDYLQHKVKVIWLTTADEANAFVIFETLNDRGLELAISDLLKNHLFSIASDRIGEVQTSWISMVSALEAVADDTMTTEFLRHYWSSHYGATRKQDLYAEMKKKTRTKTAAVNLAKDLARAAVLYASIINTDHDTWKKYGATARRHMATINNLGMVQIRPLLLAVLDNGLPGREIRKTLQSMVSWGVRFLIVGGLGGGTLEKHYADAAKLVRTKNVKTAADLKKSLASVLPRDGEFKESFAVARVSKSHLARYYLQALELKNAKTKQPELVPNTNPDDVNLEHVLPKSYGPAWKADFSAEEHLAYRRRLGNLALLTQDENSGSGADGFAKKKKVLARSSFALTSMIGAKSSWTSKEIEARQKRLAELAAKTWPL